MASGVPLRREKPIGSVTYLLKQSSDPTTQVIVGRCGRQSSRFAAPLLASSLRPFEVMTTFVWPANDPPRGRLLLHHMSRVGHRGFSQFDVHCWTDERQDWGDCTVAPVLPDPSKLWRIRRAVERVNPLSTRVDSRQ